MKQKLAITLVLALLVSLLVPAAAFAASTDSYKVTFTLTGNDKNKTVQTVTSDYSNYIVGSTPLWDLLATWANDAEKKLDEEHTFDGTGLRAQFTKFKDAAIAGGEDWTAALNNGKLTYEPVGTKDLFADNAKTVYDLVKLGKVTVTYASGPDFGDYTLSVKTEIQPVVPSGDGSGSTTTTYAPEIKAAEHGTITVNPQAAEKGAQVKITATPDEGYELDTLTVTDAQGAEIALVKNDDGTCTYTQPAGKVTITGTFKEKTTEFVNPYVDVAEGDYFYDAVMWAKQKDITNGADATHFNPGGLCTRAETVTFLWRAEGKPAPTTAEMPFEDVAAGTYYYDAVLWAVENGIVNGTDATHFCPTEKVTREQFATFLYRCAKLHGKGFDGLWSFQLDFPDASEVSDWAYEAMCWMVMNGVVLGMDGTLNPQGNALRAHVMCMLYRYENLA